MRNPLVPEYEVVRCKWCLRLVNARLLTGWDDLKAELGSHRDSDYDPCTGSLSTQSVEYEQVVLV